MGTKKCLGAVSQSTAVALWPWVTLNLRTVCWFQTLTTPETEVLFLVLTHIQRDLMTEAPGQMTLIVNCLREAFLMSEVPQQVCLVED